MTERQIGHRKSCLVLSARFPVANWRSRPVAKSAYFTEQFHGNMESFGFIQWTEKLPCVRVSFTTLYKAAEWTGPWRNLRKLLPETPLV